MFLGLQWSQNNWIPSFSNAILQFFLDIEGQVNSFDNENVIMFWLFTHTQEKTGIQW